MYNGDIDSIPSLDLNKLKIISALGRGAKGVVFLVQTEKGDLLALKTILRSSFEKKKSKSSNESDAEKYYRRVFFERDVLNSFNHPLLPKLHGVLITDNIVGYAIDYCPGRNLNSLRRKQTEKMFSDDIIRFYAAELVLALEYLHSIGIVYRDLKPENVMVQENGHLMLIDFDLSTKLSPKSPETRSVESVSTELKPEIKKKKQPRFSCLFKGRDSEISPVDSIYINSDSLSSSQSDSVEKSNSFVGTEEYVAPEIILGEGHDFSVDWWCFGVMLYEMLYGKTPFRGENRKDTFTRVVTKRPDLTGESTALRDLIGKLLEKDPKKRISVTQIKGHVFFKAVDWESITEMPRPPYIPELTDVEGKKGNEDIELESYVQGVFKVGEGEDKDEKVECGKDFEENRNRDGWMNNNHPVLVQNDNFLIF